MKKPQRYPCLTEDETTFVNQYQLEYETNMAVALLENTDPELRGVLIDYLREHPNNVYSDAAEVKLEVRARFIAGKLSGEAKEVLAQIVESPKFDGDVVSKNGKSELFGYSLIVRIANNNEFGDNAANRLGWKVHQQCIKSE